MDPATLVRLEARAKIVKAMAHPTRLFIVDQLAETDEKCVCELTEMVGADMSTVSRHLAVLKGAGILQDEKRGSQVYYALRVPCVMRFFEGVESVIRCNAAGQQELVASCDREGPLANRREPVSHPPIERKADMKRVQVLGPGCPNCAKLAEAAETAAREVGVEATIEKVTDIGQIVSFGVMTTPALVIDGEVKVVGKIPSVEEIKELLSN